MFVDPKGLRQWPFGAGKACVSSSCSGCKDAVKNKAKMQAEDSTTLEDLPNPGSPCKDADAIHYSECTLKIPDNYSCTIECDSNGNISANCKQKGFLGDVGQVWFDKKPYCYKKGEPLPDGWPPNPFQ